MKVHYILVIISILSVGHIQAQSAKQYIKSAESFMEGGKYLDAADNYSKALVIEPNNAAFFLGRAKAYDKAGKYNKALEDYERSIAIDNLDEQVYLMAARVATKMGANKKSIQYLSKAIEMDSKYVEAYRELATAWIVMGDLEKARDAVETAVVKDDKDAENYYYLGLVYDKMKRFDDATDAYSFALKKKSKVKKYHLSLAEALRNTGKDKKTMYENYEKALKLDGTDPEIFCARGIAYYQDERYDEATKDLSKAIILNPEYKDAFFYRGKVSQKLSQFQNAQNDFTKAILIDEDYAMAYFERAQCHEQVGRVKQAAEDYQQAVNHAGKYTELRDMLKKAEERLFELNMEEDKPQIVLTKFTREKDEKTIYLPRNQEEVTLEGQILDASKIKLLKCDGKLAEYQPDSLNPKFTFETRIPKSKEKMQISVIDIYDNNTNVDYEIKRTEIEAPQVELIAPYASDGNIIYLDTDEFELYVEGKIRDESHIKSIMIDGVIASYAVNSLNPSFNAKINISNKNTITVSVTDIYENITEKKYEINREGINLSKNNPMGKTWVVFIENSQYDNLASLEGPEKDIIEMKSALVGYQIDNIIHKKNMTKEQLQRFFSIDLRDLARANRVKSLLVWYSGHGKFLNETGYWIPVDAKKDDEFTYYNVNSIKTALRSYLNVDHYLTISDACETGPAFLLAMRDATDEQKLRCDNWQLTRFKSAQVLTSAGFELASDVSIFTKTFARSLKYNPNGCIAIEHIAEKVKTAVTQNQMQAPKFGKIDGLVDEGGTFFFIKK